LVKKTMRAAETIQAKGVVVAGGVAANSRLRSVLQKQASKRSLQLYIPAMAYCTDNAAMIGCIGREKLLRDIRSDLTFTIGGAALRAKYRS
jgi:N6-L-threonylcarbamoyladenine synthase